MNKVISAFALVAVALSSQAQQKTKPVEPVAKTNPAPQVKDTAEKKSSPADELQALPQFPGGQPAVEQYIKANLKYPEQAKKEKIQGRVGVRFVINKDGSVGEAKVMKGIGGGCDEEALRLIKNMPKWNPGINKMGLPVKTVYALPVNFSLK